MSIFTSILAICGLILFAVLLGLAIRSVTGDAPRRGFSDTQVFLLSVACLIFFPEGIILYLIFRPSLKQA
jgi:branched-subunit amino acid ABC-type transport system permease component